MIKMAEDGVDWNASYWDITIVVSRYAGLLSFVCSAWISAEILLDRKKRSMCYHRILLGLSFFDILASFWYIMGRLAQNQHDSFLSSLQQDDLARGTQATCNASGYFIHLGTLTIPLYNAALSIYYYLCISCGWSEEKIKKKFERFIHILIVPTALIIATIPIFLELYNNWYNTCFVTRDGNASGAPRAAEHVFNLLHLGLIIVSSCIIASSIICKGKRKWLHHNNNNNNSSEENEANLSAQTVESRRKKEEASIEASNISILYSIPFFLTWFVPLVFYVLAYITWNTAFAIIPDNPKLIFSMNLYLALFSPLQGFLNVLVYLRPRFRKFRKGNNCCRAMAETLNRSLNRHETRGDGDCYLGTGMVIEEEEDAVAIAEQADNLDDNIADDDIPEENNVVAAAEERTSAVETRHQEHTGEDSNLDDYFV